jgi:hypothetical protein
MNPRNSARIVGVLFIIGTVAGILSIFSIGALRDPDYLTAVSENENQIITGVFLVLIMGLALVPIPVILYPIFKKYNESLALAYIVFRLLEFVTYIGTILSILIRLTLSQAYVQATSPDVSIFLTFGTLLQGAEFWIDDIRLIVFSISALILNYVLYKSNLVPRWLSGFGLFAGTSHLVEGVLGMFNLLAALGILGSLLFVPILIQEMVYAVWLIAKGFNSTAIASLNAKTDARAQVNNLYQD